MANHVLTDMIKNGDQSMVIDYLRQEPMLMLSKDNEGRSLFYYAIAYERFDIIEFFISKNYQPDLIEYACLGSTEKVVKTINDQPEQMHTYSPDGWSILHIAAYYGHVSLLIKLIDLGMDIHTISKNAHRQEAIHSASAGNQKKAISCLLKHGAKIDGNGAHNSPLHISLKNKEYDIIKLLVKNGANIFAKDKEQKSAVDYALEVKDLKALQILLKVSI